MHTWDLARATGQDDRLDPDFCAQLLAGMEPIEEMHPLVRASTAPGAGARRRRRPDQAARLHRPRPGLAPYRTVTTRSARSRVAAMSTALASSEPSVQASASAWLLPCCSWRRTSRSRRVIGSTSRYHVSCSRPADLRPRAFARQEVVAFGDDQRHVAVHGPGRADGLLDLAVEVGRVHVLLGLVAQPTQQVHVAVGVEGVPRALAVAATPRDQRDVGQVEPVHRHQRAELGAELLDDGPGDRRLARSGSPGDPEQPPPALLGQPAGAFNQLGDAERDEVHSPNRTVHQC